MAYKFYAVCDESGAVSCGAVGQKAVFSTKAAAELVLKKALAQGYKVHIQGVYFQIADGEDD